MWRDGATKKLFSIIASSWVLDIARARPKHFALFWLRYIYFYPRVVCITQELKQTHNLQLLLLLLLLYCRRRQFQAARHPAECGRVEFCTSSPWLLNQFCIIIYTHK